MDTNLRDFSRVADEAPGAFTRAPTSPTDAEEEKTIAAYLISKPKRPPSPAWSEDPEADPEIETPDVEEVRPVGESLHANVPSEADELNAAVAVRQDVSPADAIRPPSKPSSVPVRRERSTAVRRERSPEPSAPASADASDDLRDVSVSLSQPPRRQPAPLAGSGIKDLPLRPHGERNTAFQTLHADGVTAQAVRNDDGEIIAWDMGFGHRAGKFAILDVTHFANANVYSPDVLVVAHRFPHVDIAAVLEAALHPHRDTAEVQSTADFARDQNIRAGRACEARMLAHLHRPHGVGLENIDGCAGFLCLPHPPPGCVNIRRNQRFGRGGPIPAGTSRPFETYSVFLGQLRRSSTAEEIFVFVVALAGILPVEVELQESKQAATGTYGTQCATGGAFVECASMADAMHLLQFNHAAVMGDFGAFIGTRRVASTAPTSATDDPRDGSFYRWAAHRDAWLADPAHGVCRFGLKPVSINLTKRTWDAVFNAKRGGWQC